MRKTSITLQELRRRIYIKAKAEKTHRFWGLYVHVSKPTTLGEAYSLVKANKGAPGVDEMTFEEVERNEGVRLEEMEYGGTVCDV